MIYFDSSALLKFVKPEKETRALREWRLAQPTDSELVTSQLAVLEISRTLLGAGVEARSYGIRRLGSLAAIHLATADPFVAEVTAFVTYDAELAAAASELGLPAMAPS